MFDFRKALARVAVIIVTFVVCGWAADASADSLKRASVLAKEENKRILNEVIEQAQEALRTLDKPDEASDERARRNRRERGQPRIVNGRGTIDYPGTGALLKGSDGRAATAWCSGTLIAPDKFLTAAHCVAKDPRPEQYKVFLHSAGFLDVKSIDWQKDLYRFPKADVAIVTLTAPVLRIQPEAILKTERPLFGTLGTIVGFGRTGGYNEDYGVKREGFIETAACPDTQTGVPLICWNFAAELQNGAIRSNTCNADSGGPLFVYEVIGGRQLRNIAGVTSGGEAEDCLLGDQSYDADVFEYSKWVVETAKLGEEPKPLGPAPALVTERDVEGETTKLSEDRAEVTYPFEVRPGISTLMVAMSGDDNGKGRNNFDLYVSRVTAAGDDTVCIEEGPGQFAFCRFENPQSGAWKVVVKRKKGRGSVQTVVTQFPER
jgi:hypothetical protein